MICFFFILFFFNLFIYGFFNLIIFLFLVFLFFCFNIFQVWNIISFLLLFAFEFSNLFLFYPLSWFWWFHVLHNFFDLFVHNQMKKNEKWNQKNKHFPRCNSQMGLKNKLFEKIGEQHLFSNSTYVFCFRNSNHSDLYVASCLNGSLRWHLPGQKNRKKFYFMPFPL